MNTVTHLERGLVEGQEAEIGRDPRNMEVAELNALGHEATPLLAIIRQNCKECCGGSEGEVRRCRLVACGMWPYRMGTNPFRSREMSDEQREAAADRLRAAREKRGMIRSEPPANAVTINGHTYYVTDSQREAINIALNHPRRWNELHGKTRHYVVREGWVTVDDGIPAVTAIGQVVAKAVL